MSKAARERLLRSAWYNRRPWPAIVLSVDSGATSGASLVESHPDGASLLHAETIDINTTRIEALIEMGIAAARRTKTPLVMSLEDWGKGGPLGIAQWIGMGAARGVWRRAFHVATHGLTDRCGRITLFSANRVLHVTATRWRSYLIQTSGRHVNGKFVRFDSEGWKAAAIATVPTLFPAAWPIFEPDGGPMGGDSAEAICQSYYVTRSDELGAALPPSYLARFGMSYPVKPRTRRKKQAR